jgi:hypothetical protein
MTSRQKNYIESTESMEQQGFITWFRLKFPEVLIFHIPNGGFRNITTAQRLRKEGVVPGVPDLCIPGWNCWIEFKRVRGGVISNEQERIIKYLENIGHSVIIGYGATDASKKLLDFLNETNIY